MTTALLLVFVL